MPEVGQEVGTVLDKMQKEWVDACAKLAADELRCDGDTVELPNGEELTLKVRADEYMSIMDDEPDSVGRLAFVESDRWGVYGQAKVSTVPP